MPRYFFDCADGGRDADLDGSDLPNLAAAQLAAVQFAGEVLRDKPQDFWNLGRWCVEVRGENRKLLFTVTTSTKDAPGTEGESITH